MTKFVNRIGLGMTRLAFRLSQFWAGILLTVAVNKFATVTEIMIWVAIAGLLPALMLGTLILWSWADSLARRTICDLWDLGRRSPRRRVPPDNDGWEGEFEAEQERQRMASGGW